MEDVEEHPQAAGLADTGMLKKVLDIGHAQATRVAQTLGVAISSAAVSVWRWINLVVVAMQEPIEFRLEVQERPRWMVISAALMLVLVATIASYYLSAAISGPPKVPSAPKLQDDTTIADIGQCQAPGVGQCQDPSLIQDQAPNLHPMQALYTQDESGVVEEICLLVRKVGAQPGRAIGAQTLYDFVNSGVGSGAARSDSLPLEKLCGACLETEARLSEIGEFVEVGEWRGNRKWAEEEMEQRLRTLERSIILISDKSSEEVYKRLFVEPLESEGYSATTTRVQSLCEPFWD